MSRHHEDPLEVRQLDLGPLFRERAPEPPPELGHFNTTHETGETLRRHEMSARRQQNLVLQFFKAHPGELFAPHEIHRRVLPEAPITSVRRAITNLATAGELLRTNTMVRSPWGRSASCWRLNPDPSGGDE